MSRFISFTIVLVALGIPWLVAALYSRNSGGQSSGCAFMLIYLVVLCLEGLLGFGICVASFGGMHGVNM